MENSFFERLSERWAKGMRVCVGLDSDRHKLPVTLLQPTYEIYDRVLQFNKAIIDATCDVVLCYKPNIGFYSGGEWWQRVQLQQALYDTILYIIKKGVPFLLDYKRGDIGATNVGYVEEAFTTFSADAVTVSPYLGKEAMQPFLDQKNKGIFVLCKTSNPGAGEFQDRVVNITEAEADKWGVPVGTTMPLYELVAHHVKREWNYNNNCGLVVGATKPQELASVREIVGDDMWLLLPGFGTQGGDVAKAIRAGKNSKGSKIIPNSSSGIIFASKGADFPEASRAGVLRLTEEINLALDSP